MPAVTFDPARMSRTIEEERCTSASMVPTMMIGLEEQVDRDGRDLSSLEIVVTGGSPVPPEVSRRWIERYGVGINNTYGMTEASPVVCATLPGDPRGAADRRRSGRRCRTSRSTSSSPAAPSRCRSASRASCARAARW